jgi:glucosamine 6-phosphate synthetase-like amidotransferase/phosphosugar isomerase protein
MENSQDAHYQQMDQENVVLMHNGILLSHKEE